MKDLARTIKAMLSAFNMADIGSGLKTQTAKVTLFNLHTGKQVHDNEVASLAAELNVPNLKDAGVDNEDIQEFIKARKAAGVSATNIPTVSKNTSKATYDEDGSANESAEDIEIQHVQHQLAHLDINVVRVENKGEKHLVVVDRDDLLLANATLRHLGVDDEFVAIAEGKIDETYSGLANIRHNQVGSWIASKRHSSDFRDRGAPTEEEIADKKERDSIATLMGKNGVYANMTGYGRKANAPFPILVPENQVNDATKLMSTLPYHSKYEIVAAKGAVFSDVDAAKLKARYSENDA